MYNSRCLAPDRPAGSELSHNTREKHKHCLIKSSRSQTWEPTTYIIHLNIAYTQRLSRLSGKWRCCRSSLPSRPLCPQ